jgi:hypothetical protein
MFAFAFIAAGVGNLSLAKFQKGQRLGTCSDSAFQALPVVGLRCGAGFPLTVKSDEVYRNWEHIL